MILCVVLIVSLATKLTPPWSLTPGAGGEMVPMHVLRHPSPLLSPAYAVSLLPSRKPVSCASHFSSWVLLCRELSPHPLPPCCLGAEKHGTSAPGSLTSRQLFLPHLGLGAQPRRVSLPVVGPGGGGGVASGTAGL